jgi:DNA-binding GntR family transcriptional regulator
LGSSFHRRIVEPAGNRLQLALSDVVDRIHQAPPWRRLREAARTKVRQHESIAEHAAIVAATAPVRRSRCGGIF